MSHSTHTFLQIHHRDNVLVALDDLARGTAIHFNDITFHLNTDVPSKHKFTIKALKPGEEVFMYGVLVGVTTENIEQGSALTVNNVHHAAGEFKLGERKTDWHKPDVSQFSQRTFLGYHRDDGSVGTANYWIVVPLVFCENRNVEVLKEALVGKLGFKQAKTYETEVEELISLYKAGRSVE
ncbi:MAG: altronate dehydratase, partial [Sphingobacteriaceae bacterium]